MSVVINTNSAATIAANNLGESNLMLQKSLSRLSSGSKIVNASDDAGGVAVAARLSSAAKRTAGVIGNIGSALSFLQQQDAALKTGSKLMERMNELQILYRDTTKSSTDKDQYKTEFLKLRDQYVTAVRNAKYNTISMMTGGNLDVTVDETSRKYTLSDLSSLISVTSAWDIAGASAASVTGTKGIATVGTGNAGDLVLKAGSDSLVTISLLTTDTMSSVIDKINSSGVAITASLSSDGYLKLTSNRLGEDLKIDTTSTAATLTALGLATGTTSASSTDQTSTEINNLATARAKNGADQSVLQYYSELASATKTNFESAVSRIMDVDVAQESTQLARWNTLVQAGTAMMAQANGSTMSALSLLKG